MKNQNELDYGRHKVMKRIRIASDGSIASMKEDAENQRRLKLFKKLEKKFIVMFNEGHTEMVVTGRLYRQFKYYDLSEVMHIFKGKYPNISFDRFKDPLKKRFQIWWVIIDETK